MAIHTSTKPPPKWIRGIKVSASTKRVANKRRITMAPTVPQITAFFCSSGASLPAAIPITTALSPANKISIKIILPMVTHVATSKNSILYIPQFKRVIQ